MENYLVTGSAGFIGANLIRYLLFNKKRSKIVGVDTLETTSAMHNVYVNKSHDFYIGDVRNRDFVSKVFELFRPTYVIHLAGTRDNDKLLETEIMGLENVLRCSSKFGVTRMIYLSNMIPMHRSNITLSDCAKQAGETLFPAFPNVSHTILRAPEVFGPRQTVGFLPNVIRGLKNLNVGMCGDGTGVRGLLYVDDLCTAIDRCLQQENEDEVSPMERGVFNVSAGNDYTDAELVSMIVDSMVEPDLRSAVSTVNWAYHGIGQLLPGTESDDAADLRTVDWKPSKKLREHIKFTCSWYKNNQWVLSDKSL